MTIDDIIEFVKNWRASHGYESGEVLSLEQMEVFIGDSQRSIMEYFLEPITDGLHNSLKM